MTCTSLHQKNRGFVLLPVLFLLAALLLVAAKATRSLNEIERLSAARMHHLEGEQVLHAALTPPPASSCTSRTGVYGDVSLERTVCIAPSSQTLIHRAITDGRLFSTTDLPRFDLVSLLEGADRCTPIQNTSAHRSPSGWDILPTSSRARETCNLPLELQASYRSFSNLDSSLPVAMRSARTPITVASPGYITLGELRIEGDLLLIAGGDIGIHSLVLTDLHRVTLIALTGRIAVNSINGRAKLKLFGREGVAIPLPPFSEDNLLLPPLLRSQALTFTP